MEGGCGSCPVRLLSSELGDEGEEEENLDWVKQRYYESTYSPKLLLTPETHPPTLSFPDVGCVRRRVGCPNLQWWDDKARPVNGRRGR